MEVPPLRLRWTRWRDRCHPRPPEPNLLGSQVETEEVLGSLRRTVAHEPEVFLCGTPDDFVSLYEEFCQENSHHCPLGSPGVAVTSPLLFALHAGSFGVWACECASCASVKYLKREEDFSNRLSVLFPTYISLSSAEKGGRSFFY